MVGSKVFDVVVIGGGPVGLASAYELAKAGSKVIVLEQNNFLNHAESSGDLARMFRTVRPNVWRTCDVVLLANSDRYAEEFMARLAKTFMKHWDALEKDAGVSLRWVSGLLNFGGGPEGMSAAVTATLAQCVY